MGLRHSLELDEDELHLQEELEDLHLLQLLEEEELESQEELDEEEHAFARHRRGRLRDEIERLTGRWLEIRSEGMALIEAPSAITFPGSGAVAHAALLFGGELVEDALRLAESGGETISDTPEPGRRIGATAGEGAWERVVEAFGDRFTADYRDDHPRLRRDALGLLGRLDLVRTDGDDLIVRPAMARYRAEVRLPDPVPTLFGVAGTSGADHG